MKEHCASLSEARLLANVRARALRLFEVGYRARTGEAGLLEVHAPTGGIYEINPHTRTCTCPFFLRISTGKPLGDPDRTCKHLLGLARLLAAQKKQARQLQIQRHNRSQWEALV